MVKGEPYGNVKDKARLLLDDMPDARLRHVVRELIETQPQHTLAALCETVEYYKAMERVEEQKPVLDRPLYSKADMFTRRPSR